MPDPTGASLIEAALSFAVLDVCGVESCFGDPWSLVCTLPVAHDGMHQQHGVYCAWETAWDSLLEASRGT